MNLHDFLEKILEMVKEKLSNDQQAEIIPVTKNNGTVLHGLTIHTEGTNICPTIYMESFYKLYQNEVSLSTIVDQILQIYTENLPKTQIDMTFFQNYSLVKDRIFYKLINYEMNKKLLSDIPHIPFWDLAIVFCYDFYSEELGVGSILIHNSHLKKWNIQPSDILKDAETNTPILFPYTLQDVNTILKQSLPNIDMNELSNEFLYVLSNKEKINGASAILYPGVISNIADKLKCNFYIIPSSTHECMILPLKDDQVFPKETMCAIISNINSSQLAPDEILTDHPFFYDWEKKQMVQLT